MYLRCSAGTVEWMYPTGALIVNLRPNTFAPSRHLTLCIKPLPDSSGANIYLEKTGELQLLVRDGDPAPGRARCFGLERGGLFVEATPQQDIGRRSAGFQYELSGRRAGRDLHTPAGEWAPGASVLFCQTELLPPPQHSLCRRPSGAGLRPGGSGGAGPVVPRTRPPGGSCAVWPCHTHGIPSVLCAFGTLPRMFVSGECVAEGDDHPGSGRGSGQSPTGRGPRPHGPISHGRERDLEWVLLRFRAPQPLLCHTPGRGDSGTGCSLGRQVSGRQRLIRVQGRSVTPGS